MTETELATTLPWSEVIVGVIVGVVVGLVTLGGNYFIVRQQLRNELHKDERQQDVARDRIAKTIETEAIMLRACACRDSFANATRKFPAEGNGLYLTFAELARNLRPALAEVDWRDRSHLCQDTLAALHSLDTTLAALDRQADEDRLEADSDNGAAKTERCRAAEEAAINRLYGNLTDIVTAIDMTLKAIKQDRL